MNNNNNNNNNNNRAGRGARGNFRRGSSNGFIPRGSSRGRGGFSGNRIGYFRSDQQHQDYGFENPRGILNINMYKLCPCLLKVLLSILIVIYVMIIVLLRLPNWRRVWQY